MMNVFSLEIGTYATIHRALFTDRVEAQSELDKLQAELNKDAYGYNKSAADKRENTWTVNSPAGPLVVVLEKIESARIVDMDAHYSIADIIDDKTSEKMLQRKIAERKALLALENASVQS